MPITSPPLQFTEWNDDFFRVGGEYAEPQECGDYFVFHRLFTADQAGHRGAVQVWGVVWVWRVWSKALQATFLFY